MVQPFAVDPHNDQIFYAALTTGERLYLASIAGDVMDLLAADLSEHEIPEATAGELPGHRTHDQSEEALSASFSDLVAGLNLDSEISAPRDPAVLRLLPQASLDPLVAQEFRRFTDRDLRLAKANRLAKLSELLLGVAGDEHDDVHVDLEVSAEQAPQIAGAINDIRLVLAERLEIETEAQSETAYELAVIAISAEEQEDLTEDEYRRYLLASLFVVTGYLLESLSECVLQAFRRGRGQDPEARD